MKNFLTRIITATIFGVVFIGSIIWGEWSFAALFLLISIIGILEFYKLVEKGGYQAQKLLGTLIGVFLFVSVYFIYSPHIKFEFLFLLFPLTVLVFIIELYRKKENPFANIAITFLGIAYVVLPFSLLSSFVFSYSGSTMYTPNILLGVFFLIWIYDSGAYIFGVSLGKHRMFERISPKKSWEGFFGGTLSALVLAWFISGYFTSITMFDWMFIALIVIIVGTYGDLVESMLKRSLGIKDSGKILPGHGGILDRFDAVLLCSPLIFTYLELVY